jgi:hypothetical protein
MLRRARNHPLWNLIAVALFVAGLLGLFLSMHFSKTTHQPIPTFQRA